MVLAATPSRSSFGQDLLAVASLIDVLHICACIVSLLLAYYITIFFGLLEWLLII